MAQVKFSSGEQIPLEMHKVRIVQKLELVIHGNVVAALQRMRTDKPASNGAE